jgi:hypothetical protein
MKRERKAVQRCCTSSQAFRSPSTAATCLEADSWEEFDVWLKANPHTIELYTNIHKQHKWHDMSTRSLCLFTTQHGIQVLAKLLLLTSKLLSVCVCVRLFPSHCGVSRALLSGRAYGPKIDISRTFSPWRETAGTVGLMEFCCASNRWTLAKVRPWLSVSTTRHLFTNNCPKSK